MYHLFMMFHHQPKHDKMFELLPGPKTCGILQRAGRLFEFQVGDVFWRPFALILFLFFYFEV